MDSQTLEFLEFASVLEIISEAACTPQGKADILRLLPSVELGTICDRQSEIEEAARLRAEELKLGFDLPAAEPVLTLLTDRGALLTPVDLLALLDYLKFADSARSLLSVRQYPHLGGRIASLAIPGQLLHRIEDAIDERGEVRDSAHPELGSVRRRVDQFRSRVQEHLRSFLRGKRSRYLTDEPFVTQRADRYVLPVRVEHQKDIPGIVHGTSSSGATVFLEPFTAVDLNNQLIFNQERALEIVREVLLNLTAEARSHLEDLEGIVAFSGLLESRLACASFAERFFCCVPQVEQNGPLEMKQARHPLLIRSLGRESVVPIDIHLGSDERILVISGPNTGGKTAALKTVGLLALLAHAGLPVPAAAARAPLLKGVYADIGDQQSITQNQSTFSAHIERVREIAAVTARPSLLLLDELGRGTDPAYGSALAVALLEHLRRGDQLVLATTHHRAVKSYAALTSGVSNASVRLDSNTLRPTYVLEYGVAGGSSGLEIAAQLGLPEEVVEHARSLLDDKDSLAEGFLTELRRRIEEFQLREKEYATRLEELGREKLEVQRQAELRRQKFDKEAERLLETLAEEFRGASRRFVKSIADRKEAHEIQQRLQHREAALKEEFRRSVKQSRSPREHPSTAPVSALAPGELVYYPFLRSKGRVVAIDGETVTVEMGGKTVSAPVSQLQKIEREAIVEKPSPQVTVQVVRDTDPELNLIGKTVDEAQAELDKFLDRAFVSRLSEVTIIHGFGTGRLKAFVTEFLAGHHHVTSFEVEGGSTRAQLEI